MKHSRAGGLIWFESRAEAVLITELLPRLPQLSLSTLLGAGQVSLGSMPRLPTTSGAIEHGEASSSARSDD